jgi:hypothetical protein
MQETENKIIIPLTTPLIRDKKLDEYALHKEERRKIRKQKQKERYYGKMYGNDEIHSK